MLANDNLLADFSRELTKLIQIGQKNAAKLDTVIKNQERLEAIVNEQKVQILEIRSKLEVAIEYEVEDIKVKKKGKKPDEFYHVNIHILAMFYTMLLIFFNIN